MSLPGGIVPMMIVRYGGQWLAFPITLQHHDECGDPECPGAMLPANEPIARSFFRGRLEKKVLRWIKLQAITAAQVAASESLGG